EFDDSDNLVLVLKSPARCWDVFTVLQTSPDPGDGGTEPSPTTRFVNSGGDSDGGGGISSPPTQSSSPND
ncbi:hypothetical protein TWF751_000801, partial [Orbilia oligospora]